MNLLQLLTAISAVSTLLLMAYAVWQSHRHSKQTRGYICITGRRFEIVDTYKKPSAFQKLITWRRGHGNRP